MTQKMQDTDVQVFVHNKAWTNWFGGLERWLADYEDVLHSCREPEFGSYHPCQVANNSV